MTKRDSGNSHTLGSRSTQSQGYAALLLIKGEFEKAKEVLSAAPERGGGKIVTTLRGHLHRKIGELDEATRLQGPWIGPQPDVLFRAVERFQLSIDSFEAEHRITQIDAAGLWAGSRCSVFGILPQYFAVH